MFFRAQDCNFIFILFIRIRILFVGLGLPIRLTNNSTSRQWRRRGFFYPAGRAPAARHACTRRSSGWRPAWFPPAGWWERFRPRCCCWTSWIPRWCTPLWRTTVQQNDSRAETPPETCRRTRSRVNKERSKALTPGVDDGGGEGSRQQLSLITTLHLQ